jgi:hypothetical protein
MLSFELSFEGCGLWELSFELSFEGGSMPTERRFCSISSMLYGGARPDFVAEKKGARPEFVRA